MLINVKKAGRVAAIADFRV